MKYILFFWCFSSAVAYAHVPALVLPLRGTPITSYFIGNSAVSRAVYSEITKPGDYFVVQFRVERGSPGTLVQLFTPECDNIPQYERFQPSAILLRGELPWPNSGESRDAYLKRLEKKARVRIGSNFAEGQRPKFFEEFGKQSYWVGGEWRGALKPGLYSIVVFDREGHSGNFNFGLNEKEAWTPELFAYADAVVQDIRKGICSPNGFSGLVRF